MERAQPSLSPRWLFRRENANEEHALTPAMYPVLEARSPQFDRAFASGPKPCRDALRRMILQSNEACGSWQRKILEEPIARGPRRLGRETLAPEGWVDRVSDRRFRPVGRL